VAYLCPFAQRAWIARNYKVVPSPSPPFSDLLKRFSLICGVFRERETETFFCSSPSVQGLQDKIKIVAIDLADRPAWYKEKVYPENKVCLTNLLSPLLFRFSKVHGYFVLHFSFTLCFVSPVGAFSRARQPGERRELGFG
jgi:hypothetical protein